MWFKLRGPEQKQHALAKKEHDRKEKERQLLQKQSQVVLTQAGRTSNPKPKPAMKPSKKQLISVSTPNLLAAPSKPPKLPHRPRSSQPRESPAATSRRVEYMNQSAALADRISDRMNNVLTSLDAGREPHSEPTNYRTQAPDAPPLPPRHPLQLTTTTTTTRDPTSKLPTSSHFDRVWLYANARLPPQLPPLKLYLPTYPLLCLAGRHSLSVYSPTPTKPTHTAQPTSNAVIPHRAPSTISTYNTYPASFLAGTKAMTIATATHDTATSPVVLIAIRGSSTFMDWAVNARQAPTSPAGFLADAGNLCHAGFLAVARQMAQQIARELQRLLAEKPGREKASLVLTGHSAGGAVAALLYMHVMATYVQGSDVRSELTDAAGRFKRVHCITFGAPPVTLLPLQRPEQKGNRRLEKSLFLGFVNEGDPVARADREYVKSLLCLYTAPPPEGSGVAWPVPVGTLSCAGRVVLLRPRAAGQRVVGGGGVVQKRALFKRSSPNLRGGVGKIDGNMNGVTGMGENDERIEACTIDDEMLRGAVFGDPMMHAMRVYAERVEKLAVDAVTAGGVR